MIVGEFVALRASSERVGNVKGKERKGKERFMYACI